MILFCLISISGYSIYKIIEEDDKQVRLLVKLDKIAEESLDKVDNKIELENEKVNEFFKTNNDIVGWIKIEGTNIDYPVMQSKNNPNYYLKRNFNKEYSNLGTPYLDGNCDLKTSDNLIIYGHHITRNRMFGELENYKSKEFYKKHSVIEFYDKESKKEYDIIYVFKTKADIGFKYNKYINFNDKSEFETFRNECEKLAFYNIDKDIKYDNKFITLSTCEYSQENGRLVVIAKLKD